MNLRQLITEYILFAYDEQQLLEKFNISAAEIDSLSDIDLLEIYDCTLIMEPLER